MYGLAIQSYEVLLLACNNLLLNAKTGMRPY